MAISPSPPRTPTSGDGNIVAKVIRIKKSEFLSAVADGEPFSPSFEDGFAVQRVLDAVERAADRGEWVEC
jgi:predicted dehydrogenase